MYNITYMQIIKIYGMVGVKNIKKITLPILFLPYPIGIKINMVHISYVVKSFISIALSDSAYNGTYHLTHPNPPSFIKFSKIIFNELSIYNVKYVGLSPKNFRKFIDLAYFIAIPWRKYIKSARSYLPYMTYNQIYVRDNINRYNTEPKKFTENFFRELAKEAFDKVYPKAKI